MFKVGLTGNIGSGKTTVTKIFRVLGIPVFNADIEAKQLYNQEGLIKILVSKFSDSILTNKGEIDKSKLASVVFNDSNALKKINSIIHPLVLEQFQLWCIKHKDKPYIIHETAIIFENNLQGNFDFIINVSAPVNLRVKRVLNRDNLSENEIKQRLSKQLSDEEKCEKSNFVIVNDEDSLLIPQVQNVHKLILSKIEE
jgi:dephospho-CoA kinase